MTVTSGTVLRPLDELAVELRRKHEAAEAAWLSAVEHALEAGRVLLEAKVQVRHGEWIPWVEQNFHASVRTAQQYMQLARRAENARALAHLGFHGVLRELATRRPTLRPSVEEMLRDFGPLDGAMEELGEASAPKPGRASLSKGRPGKSWRNIREELDQAERARSAAVCRLEAVRDGALPDVLAAEELRLGVDCIRAAHAHEEEAAKEMLELAAFMLDAARR